MRSRCRPSSTPPQTDPLDCCWSLLGPCVWFSQSSEPGQCACPGEELTCPELSGCQPARARLWWVLFLLLCCLNWSGKRLSTLPWRECGFVGVPFPPSWGPQGLTCFPSVGWAGLCTKGRTTVSGHHEVLCMYGKVEWPLSSFPVVFCC